MIKVVLSNVKKIYGLNDYQTERIKDELLVDNPAYYQAKKHSRYQNIRIDKYLRYFTERKDCLEVPLGYCVPFEVQEVLDERVEVTVKYPRFVLNLRKTQEEAARAYISDTDCGIISLPTGKGKSILGIYIASLLRQKTLVIVHKDDLVVGWQNDIRDCFGGAMSTGLYKASKRVVGDQITISTVQTLSRLSAEEWKDLEKEFGMIIVDEMHHVPASTYEVINRFYAQYKLGLSATPERSDGLEQVMHYYLGHFAFVYESDGDEQDILPVQVIVRDSSVFYRPRVVEIRDRNDKLSYRLTKGAEQGDKFIDEIDHKLRPRISHHVIDDCVCKDLQFVRQVLEDVREEFNKGRSCVIFFSQKDHVRLWQEYLTTEGLPEQYVQLYYGDMTEKKSVVLERAENNRQLITLTTYSIATEGTNVKQWEVAFLISSINDEKNTEQVVGRVRRTKENKINPVLVYDYRHEQVYTFKSHGATRDRRYRKLGFKITKQKKSTFSRGYKRR